MPQHPEVLFNFGHSLLPSLIHLPEEAVGVGRLRRMHLLRLPCLKLRSSLLLQRELLHLSSTKCGSLPGGENRPAEGGLLADLDLLNRLSRLLLDCRGCLCEDSCRLARCSQHHVLH